MRVTTKGSFIGFLIWAVMGLLFWQGGGLPAWSYCSGTIGNFVWNDLNGNGCQDPGEPGICDVKVTLTKYTSDGPVKSYTRTNDYGYYEFICLCAGDYEISFETPAGFTRTHANMGCDPGGDETDSDCDGHPIPVTLSDHSNKDLTIDCGYVAECDFEIGDFVWNDLNGNGCQDAGEPGLSNVKVILTGDALGEPVEAYTNDHGYYLFTGLCAGDYEVVFKAPAGFSRTAANVGCEPGGDGKDSDCDGEPICVTLSEHSPRNLTIDCGYVAECDFEIGDFVWHDLNGNGCQDPGERGIPGVEVRLTGYASGEPVEFSTKTDGDGYYLFTGLCAGDYEVVFETPAGYARTDANVGCEPGGDGTDSDCDGHPIPVTLSEHSPRDLTIDCGYVAECDYEIGDFVWHDMDGNGCQDPGEPGIPGVTVILTGDTPTGPVKFETDTDGNGYYWFTGLCAGEYEVVFKTPEGYARTDANVGCDPGGDETDSDCHGHPIPVTLSEHSPRDLTIDCGYVAVCDFEIGDFVWNDKNGNGCQDPGEPGIPKVKVILTGDTLGEPVEAYTDGDGYYLFTGLCAGDYEVVFETPAGYSRTDANVGCEPGGDKTDSDCNGYPIPVTLSDLWPRDLTIDCGYVAECDLHIDKKCLVMPSPVGYECTDKIVATTLSYIGNPIPRAVRVEIDPDKGPTKTFTFMAGLYPGTEISIDARFSSESDLGSKIRIRINGAEEVIHTSCSTPYAAGKPAPLDNPKGAPSPNWFVESFVDKDSDAVIVLPVPEFSDSCTATLGPIASCQLLKDIGQKLTSITFKYTGGGCSASDNAQDPSKAVCSGKIDSELPVKVISHNGYSIVPAMVAPGEEFTASAGSFDSNSFFILSNSGGTEMDQIHTSCSQPLAVGNVFGSLTVTAINGQKGGAEVIYAYRVINKGDDLTDVTLVDKVGDTDVFKAGPFDLAKGESKDISWKATLWESTTNTATVTGNTASYDTCEAGDSVTVTVTEPCNICKGGTVELTFQYLGAASANVSVYDDNEAKPDKILFKGTVQPDGKFTITPRPGEDKFNNDISLYLGGMFNTQIHTSCSKPLFPGLIFGDFKVVTARSKDNGLICPPDCAATPAASLETKDRTVKWQLINTGITSLVVKRILISWPEKNGALKKIKLDGDIFKDALLGPPAATLPDDAAFVGTVKNRELEPGETRKLEFEFMNDVVTDQSEYGITVVFFGEGDGCSLHFTAAPGQAICTTKVRAMTLRYIGPDILGADVEIVPDRSPTVVYSNVDLVSGKTILSRADENGFTITALPDENDLGAKTRIRINGIEEVIHTSCSTDFVSGKPAPLDNPKGAPSPNWFVENFTQKP